MRISTTAALAMVAFLAPRAAGAQAPEELSLRDPKGRFRLEPRVLLALDGHAWPVAPERAGSGQALGPRLVARRLRLGFGAELFRRWSFEGTVDLGGQPIENPGGRAQIAAAPAGRAPSADTARFAPLQAPAPAAAIADAWMNYRVCACLNVLIGQQKIPYSFENRTDDHSTVWNEALLPIRSFALASPREVGVTLWGAILTRDRLSYEIGVFGGDGANRPQADGKVDFAGRVFGRPFGAGPRLLERFHVGVSAHHGARDPAFVGYDVQPITSGQGVALWDPRRLDARGRIVHVLPSGAQDAMGVELDAPLGRFALRGEGHYVVHRTREAIDGYQLTNTERLGAIRGFGWFAEVSAWPLGDAFVASGRGLFGRPERRRAPFRDARGLEVAAMVGGVSARYESASRGGAHDAGSPGRPDGASSLRVLQLGAGVSYWYTRHLRGSLNYIAYRVPEDGLTRVPGAAGAAVLHELGFRLGFSL